ncbi:MAG: type II restriction endonuclease [Campylobacterota bacterium]|nr:type II restriction endonuclease [Campylobacterota bacterium]
MTFEEKFNDFIPELTKALTVPNSTDWTVKGFIDYYQNIYSISTDTKVVSKVIELMIFPKFLEFAQRNNLQLKLSPHQNYYPDITFIDNNGKKYAVDLKSTYRATATKVNGMTLGAFTEYFRNRQSNKNTLYPYGEYHKHYVFGIIYSRADISKIEEYFLTLKIKSTVKLKKIIIEYINENTTDNWNKIINEISNNIQLTNENKKIVDSYLINETKTYNLENFTKIQSVIKDFEFFIQEKWKIALDRPGSGNTKNIGSEVEINKLKSGNGLFKREFGENGKNIFNNYWMNYETKDMAKANGKDTPSFKNIETYLEWIKSLTTN